MIAKEDFPMEYQTYEVLDGLTCAEWRRLFAVSIPVAIVHKQFSVQIQEKTSLFSHSVRVGRQKHWKSPAEN